MCETNSLCRVFVSLTGVESTRRLVTTGYCPHLRRFHAPLFCLDRTTKHAQQITRGMAMRWTRLSQLSSLPGHRLGVLRSFAILSFGPPPHTHIQKSTVQYYARFQASPTLSVCLIQRDVQFNISSLSPPSIPSDILKQKMGRIFIIPTSSQCGLKSLFLILQLKEHSNNNQHRKTWMTNNHVSSKTQ
jgi:hypothetical protein